MRLLLGLCALLTLQSQVCSAAVEAEDTPSSRTSDILQSIDSSVDDSAAALALSTSGSVCPDGADAAFFAGLVGKGLVQTALQLAKACVESGQKLDDQEIQKTVNQLRKRLSDLTMFVQASNRESSHVFPAFEWAQSRDSIFISVKFAHKLDTPACIDVAEDKAEMERSSVVVSAVCKGKNKRFTLDLQLLKEIDPSNSTWAMASVGRGMLTLKKAEEKKWPRLLKTRDRVKNMHKWFSLQEKYEQDLKDLENELEKQAAEAESAANGDSMDPASPSANQENDAASSVAASAPPTEKPTEDIERQRQRKAAKKKAKSEKKRLKKQRSKSLKAVDERTKQRKEELDKEAEQEKQTIRDKHEEELKAVDAALQKALEAIDTPEDGSDPQSLLGRLSGFFSSSKAEAATEGAQVDKDQEL